MRRIIVIKDQAPVESRNKLSDWIKTQRVGWWHWFQQAWLLTDPQDRPVSWWRDQIRDLLDKEFVLVIDADGGTWSAFAKSESFDWFKKNWLRPSDANVESTASK